MKSSSNPAPLTCPRCGSSAVRRSMPRTLSERIARLLTPYHFFLCRDCEYRGRHWGPIRTSGAAEPFACPYPARPVEKRDHELKQLRRRRVIASLLIAAALGIATGLFLHGCRQDIETRSWVAQ